MTEESLGKGWRVGHWTSPDAVTGCTVILPPRGGVASYDIRGSSPSERELALLHPDRKLTEIHALLLTGSSAFGLAAAAGVMEWLEERGIGYETRSGPIPIVPAAVIFDGGAARSDLRPGAAEGRLACEDAVEGPVRRGRVGAGAGATIGKWAGLEHSVPGGLGTAAIERGGQRVAALAVVNAVGDVVGDDGTVLAGSTAPTRFNPGEAAPPDGTVLAVVTTTAPVGKRGTRWLAQRGSDGITIAIRPAHTRYDGDVVFAVAAPPPEGGPSPDLDRLGYLATAAVAAAIRDAVAH